MFATVDLEDRLDPAEIGLYNLLVSLSELFTQ